MECQPINMRKMKAFENPQAATITALINPGKNHAWTLKLACKSAMRHVIASKYVSSKYVLTIKRRYLKA